MHLHFYIHTQQLSPSSWGRKVCREIISWDLSGFSLSFFPPPQVRFKCLMCDVGISPVLSTSQQPWPGATEHSHVNISNSQVKKNASGKFLWKWIMHRHGCSLQMGSSWYRTVNTFSVHHKSGSFQRKWACDFIHVLQLIWMFSYQEKNTNQETSLPAKDSECFFFQQHYRDGRKRVKLPAKI